MTRKNPGGLERYTPVKSNPDDHPIAIWLLSFAAMIFIMALIGAATRLTESGLSIMEWAPVMGALPPLNESEWQRVFELYRGIPEYLEENHGMTLEGFKTIFWWEYIHRLWGRLIGAVLLIGFLWFLIRGKLRKSLAPEDCPINHTANRVYSDSHRSRQSYITVFHIGPIKISTFNFTIAIRPVHLARCTSK